MHQKSRLSSLSQCRTFSVAEPPLFWAAAPAPEVRSPGADSGLVRSAPGPGIKGQLRLLTGKIFNLNSVSVTYLFLKIFNHCFNLYKLNWIHVFLFGSDMTTLVCFFSLLIILQVFSWAGNNVAEPAGFWGRWEFPTSLNNVWRVPDPN